jgi:hypothetical protein
MGLRGSVESLHQLTVFGQQEVSSTGAKNTNELLGGWCCRGAILGKNLDVGQASFAHGISQLSLEQRTDFFS